MKKLRLKLIAISVVTITTATLPSVSASAAWIQNGSDWNYLSDSGERKTGWINDNGAWYYLDNSGTMKTGWVNDDGTWYYMLSSGEMKTGWVNDSGTWYYLNNSGAMKTGWINDNGTWYFSDVSGAMQTGIVQVDGKTYSLDAATGAMQVGNVTIDGKVYTFAQNGEAVGDNIPTAKAFNSDGVELTGTNTSGKDTNESNGSSTSATSQENNNNSNSNSNSNSSSHNHRTTVTKTALIKVITAAKTKYTTAVEGTEVGQYAFGSKATLKTAIDAAQAVLDNATSTQKDIDSAVTALATAMTTFDNSINNDNHSSKVHTEALKGTITAAKTKYTIAVEGTEVGQYAFGSKATLKTAIDAAQAVLDNVASTQKDIDSAVTALEAAMATFENSINNNSNEDVNAGVSTNYLEDYREQYHFSVAKAWSNDPNGMVYFNGEYHLFYQYYPNDVVWGPMHWGHAVSTDLIHWEELGMAIAPDGNIPSGNSMNKDWYKYGENWIYSGCAVVDKDNTSGFFDGIEGGGLVAIYTQHLENPRTEQQAIAYSKDNGRTWIKPVLTAERKNLVLTAAEDPLNNAAQFRDPKVFYNDEAGKWFMVTAGGPLRFFSSTDLKTWKPEAMQDNINTECPDFFKLKVEGTNEEKWVLSEGGRYYRVGDFKEVDGVWKFVPDTDEHFVMNFSKDAYAAQTYYGTGANGTPDGRRILINWMNNWDYCNAIAPITKTFNGQYTLQNELKLVETADGIRLTQQPIKEYETLRQSPTTFENVTISPDKPNIMSNLSGSQYEIVGEFEPTANTTEFGFKLRVGKDAGQETIVKYNVATGEVTLDRTKSGKGPNNFLQSYSSKISKTSDGKIQLHIFVDSSSVEVYGNNGEITGSAQIFPNRSSEGIEVYSLGGDTKATINYYPIKGIWNNDVKGNNSVALSLSESNFTKEVGEQFSIFTSTIPTTAAQGVSWAISDPSIVKIVSQDDSKTTFEVIGKGTTDLTATSKDGRSTAKASLSVYNRNVTSDISNLTGFQSFGGNWYVDNNVYVGDGAKVGDAFATSDQKNDDLTATYTFTADAKLLDGGDVAALTLFSKEKDPFKGSIVANIIKNGDWRVFNFPGGQNVASGHIEPTADNIYHLKAEIKGSHIKYWINDQLLCDKDQSFYDTGYFGLGVCNAKVEFTNAFLNKEASDTSTLELNKTAFEQSKGDTFTVYSNQEVNWSIEDSNIVQLLSKDGNKTTFEVINSGATTLTATSAANSSLKQDVSVEAYERDPETVDGLVEGLTNFQTHNGNWYVKNDAYEVNVSGDGFSTSDTKIDIENNPDTTYTFEADADILSGDVAELVLFAQSKDNPQGDGSLVANVIRNNTYNLFTFGKGGIKAGDLDDSGKSTDGKYHLKAEVKGTHLKYTINNQVIYDGEQNFFTSGYLGLGACNANVAFTNIKFTKGTTDTGAGTTDTGAGTTDTGAGTTDTGAGTTDTGAGTTDTGAGTTDTGAGTTDTGAGTTDTGAGTTDTGTGTTHTGAGTTDTGAGTTDTGAGTTDTGAGTTDTGDGTTDAGAGTTDAGVGTTDTGATVVP